MVSACVDRIVPVRDGQGSSPLPSRTTPCFSRPHANESTVSMMGLLRVSRLNADPLRILRRKADGRDIDNADPPRVSTNTIAELLADCALPGETLIVGVTGSVAAGKTTLCSAVAHHLQSTLQIETVSTDGFLFSNETLAARELSMRKGYPETYDLNRMSGALQRVRLGPVCFPGYSHRTYDVAPELDRTISRPDILLIEGLGLSPTPDGRNPRALLDMLIYVDAGERDLEIWFVARFMQLWHAADRDESSFYFRFRTLTEEQAAAFAKTVWTQINLPNLRENIVRARDMANLVLTKSLDHSLRIAAI
jgi:type I pantothenate kinase